MYRCWTAGTIDSKNQETPSDPASHGYRGMLIFRGAVGVFLGEKGAPDIEPQPHEVDRRRTNVALQNVAP